MYQNMLNGALKLPLYLTEDACDLVMKLMKREAEKRLGAGREGAEEIKRHSWFKSIDWKIVKQRGLEVPKPEISGIPEGHMELDLLKEEDGETNNIEDWEYSNKIEISI